MILDKNCSCHGTISGDWNYFLELSRFPSHYDYKIVEVSSSEIRKSEQIFKQLGWALDSLDLYWIQCFEREVTTGKREEVEVKLEKFSL